MSRSGFVEDWDGGDSPFHLLQPSILKRACTGRRGRTFLLAVANAMDAMPEKRLIAGKLVTPEGECCAMGTVCKARGMDVEKIDYDDPDSVAEALDISPTLAREIAYRNDDDFGYETKIHGSEPEETPEDRWTRMRKWIDEALGGKT